MAVEPVVPYQQLNVVLSERESLVVIQPHVASGTGGKLVETLAISLQDGSVKQLPSQAMPAGQTALVLLGVAKLIKGAAVVVATTARVVATVLDADIYEVTGTRILTTKAVRAARENRGLLNLLSQAVEPEGVGRSMYFSHFYDVTLTAQRTSVVAQDQSPARQTAAGRADQTFFWNQALVKPVMEAGAHRFVMPVMFGFIKQLPDLQLSGAQGNVNASLTLIARRGVQRAGTRHWRRGADAEGNVANFVESEQLLQVKLPGSATPVVASYVQVRGSIPLLWTELPNLKYKPTKVIAPPEEQIYVFSHHIRRLQEQYKHVEAINLINQHGGEGKLEKAFSQAFETYKANGGKDAGYVAFDFHKQCGAKNYERMSVLWDQVKTVFDSDGYFLHNSSGVARKQQGVMRTNCIDCLDRTNVVQGMFARKNLEQVLQQLSLLPQGKGLEEYPALEKEYRILWADHGDAIATQYAGTGALKSGFTRTGKRTIGGILDDGVKSVTRYYVNNFQDGTKQDALDLVTGAFTPAPSIKNPLKRQSSPLVPLALVLMLVALSVHTLVNAGGQRLLGAAPGSDIVEGKKVLALVLGPLAVAGAVLFLMVQNGRHLVNKPQLCPSLAATTTEPKKK